MERTERNEKDDTQKAKLIFCLWRQWFSYFLSGASRLPARPLGQDAAKQELELVRQDNLKLEQMQET
jgi:hypothetical protein